MALVPARRAAREAIGAAVSPARRLAQKLNSNSPRPVQSVPEESRAEREIPTLGLSLFLFSSFCWP
jgi:hypothetical protein